MKRIVICADGTWNRPERNTKDSKKQDYPTNVLKMARAIKPVAEDGTEQVVFYDWGLGSYHESVMGGAFGKGINKNIMDNYRFIVQNYKPGDELYFFGFSRGAYTVRSLAGFINNCSILKRSDAREIEKAFAHYKTIKYHPRSQQSTDFRRNYAIQDKVRIKFIGVWDTVGALGVPLRMLGFMDEKNLFYDNKIGPNIDIARHALSIDELRKDFEPTIWLGRENMDLKQVWFSGVHSDVGGGYKPDKNKHFLSDIPLNWMLKEAEMAGLSFEPHLKENLTENHLAGLHQEYKGFFKVLGKHTRKIEDGTFIHRSVKKRYLDDSSYRPDSLKDTVNSGWPSITD